MWLDSDGSRRDRTVNVGVQRTASRAVLVESGKNEASLDLALNLIVQRVPEADRIILKKICLPLNRKLILNGRSPDERVTLLPYVMLLRVIR